MLGRVAELERFAGWLACPDCERDLDPVATDVVGCSSGHRFERNRRGHLGLVPTGWRLPGDDPGRGASAVDAAALAPVLAAMLPRRGRVLELSPVAPDTQAVIFALGTPLVSAALSSSPRSLERIASATGAETVLADPARRWPVRDGALGALLVTGTDLVPVQFHRVLAPGGFVLSAPPESAVEQVMDDLYPWFEHDQSRPVTGVRRTAIRLRRRRRMLTC